jgi:hypothetical protein
MSSTLQSRMSTGSEMSLKEPRAEDLEHVIVRRPRTALRWYNSKLGDR